MGFKGVNIIQACFREESPFGALVRRYVFSRCDLFIANLGVQVSVRSFVRPCTYTHPSFHSSGHPKLKSTNCQTLVTCSFTSLIVLAHLAKQGRQLSLSIFWCLFSRFSMKVRHKLQRIYLYFLEQVVCRPLCKRRLSRDILQVYTPGDNATNHAYYKDYNNAYYYGCSDTESVQSN